MSKTFNISERYDPRQYATLAVWWSGVKKASLLADNKCRVVVFDNAQTAQDFMPLLGMGRRTSWDVDGETCYFSPLDLQGYNKAAIITGYDVYNLPPNHPVRSETKLRGWKHHVIWTQWREEVEKRN